jgi:hypothetical protein
MVHQIFPGFAKRFLASSDWHQEQYGIRPLFGLFWNLCINSSDGHGFAGTGHAGTGAGDQIVTRDIPVPVPAGNGYVTGT